MLVIVVVVVSGCGLLQVFNCLTQDKELPVKVEAAVAMQYLIKNQHVAAKIIEPHVKAIISGVCVCVCAHVCIVRKDNDKVSFSSRAFGGDTRDRE